MDLCKTPIAAVSGPVMIQANERLSYGAGLAAVTAARGAA